MTAPVPRPVHEVALALVKRDGRWLVARRRHDVHLPGMWEFPGGKREGDESATMTALREVKEECGIEAVALREGEAVLAEYDDRRVRLTPVVCQWLAGEPRPLGCAECRWVDAGELAGLNMPAVNAGIVAQVMGAGW